MSTTDYQSYIDDLDWWFPPQRIYLKAHEDIDPEALYDELEYADGLPDYSDIPHGSNVELIPVPVIEEVWYPHETLWQEYM